MRAGKALKLDLPLDYVNPPILVPHGTATTIGAPQVHIFREDLLAALQEMVGQTVEMQA
jgi:hypothetical protein